MSVEKPSPERLNLAEKAKAILDCLALALYENKTLQDAELLDLSFTYEDGSETWLQEEAKRAQAVLETMATEQRIALYMRAGSLSKKNPFTTDLAKKLT